MTDALVVGLGNPGRAYQRTRHNLGQACVEVLAGRAGETLKAGRDRAMVATASLDGKQVVLAFPTTYMNDSGFAVAALMRRHGVRDPAQLIVVHDELDLPVAALKLKQGGGLAGHNGLKSVKNHLHSDAFLRVRIGVGKPVSKEHGVDHVLKKFSKRERTEIDVTIEQAADAVELIVTDGIDTAMNRYN